MLKFPPSNVIRSILPPSANLTVPRMTIIKCDTLMFKAWLEISVLSIYDKTKTKKVVVYFFILIIIGVIILVFKIFTPNSLWQSTFFFSITFFCIKFLLFWWKIMAFFKLLIWALAKKCSCYAFKIIWISNYEVKEPWCFSTTRCVNLTTTLKIKAYFFSIAAGSISALKNISFCNNLKICS